MSANSGPTNLYLFTELADIKRLPIISRTNTYRHISNWLTPMAEYLGAYLRSGWIGGDTTVEPFTKNKYFYILWLKDEVDWFLPEDFEKYHYRFYRQTKEKNFNHYTGNRTRRAFWSLREHGSTIPNYYDYDRGITVKMCTKSEAEAIFDYFKDLYIPESWRYTTIFWDKDVDLETNLARIKEEHFDGRDTVL